MKRTNFLKQIAIDNRKYKLKKSIAYLQMRLSFGEKHKQKERAYSIYQHDFHFNSGDNALPEQYYFKPTDIIIYDLIRKEDLSATKKGLIRLLKKCYSHKFIGGSRSEEDIEVLITGLDQTIHSGNSWYKTSIFDFAYDDDLESYIKCFEISFHNFSSSYADIEMSIELYDEFINQLSQFIKESYKKPGMCVHRMWGRNRKKSGAKIMYAVSTGVTNEYAKSQLIYEQLQYVKLIFLQEIVKYFPLMQYSKYKNVESINVFETNITPSLRLDKTVYAGLGLDELQGFYFSSSERLYISSKTMMSKNTDMHDMMFVYNPDLVTDYEMYCSAHNKVLAQLTIDYMNELYRVIILKSIARRYQELISDYRNRINECKNSKRQHRSLLKLQFQFNQDFYNFKKIDEELPVGKELERADKILKKNKYAKASIYYKTHTCKYFTDIPKWMWKQIRYNYTEVANDLKRKLEISDSLAKYSSERKNRNMAVIQVVLAVMTFFLLIFPNKAQELAALIERIWNYLSSLF